MLRFYKKKNLLIKLSILFKGWDKLWSGRTSKLNEQTIDQIQKSIECCGSSTFLDYGLSIPPSCCPPNTDSCNQLFAYRVGCKDQIKNVVQNSATMISYFSIVMAVAEVIL